MLENPLSAPAKWSFRIIVLVGYVIWFVVAYVSYNLWLTPSFDSWCYFAPAVFAEAPFQLHTPLMGEFKGADQMWGLHWPGAVWLHSLFLFPFPNDDSVVTVYMLLVWSGAASLLGLLCAHLTGNVWLAAFFFFYLLGGPIFFGLTHEMRPEVLLSVVYLAALLLLLRYWQGQGGTGTLLGLGVLSFLLTMMHPMGVLVAFTYGLFIAWLWWRGEWSLGAAAWVAACMLAGLGVAYGSLRSDPVIWDQFLAHADFNLKRIDQPWGGSLLAYFGNMGGKLLVGWVFVLGSLLAGAYYLFLYVKQGGRPGSAEEAGRIDVPASGLVAWSVLLGLILAGFQHSENYFAILLPLQFALCAVLIQDFVAPLNRWLRYGCLAALLVFLAALSLHWPARVYNNLAVGMGDRRAELSAFYQALPPAKVTLVPVKLWQAASMDPLRRALLTSPSFNVAGDYRREYEEYVGGLLSPGDLVIIDDQFRVQPTIYLSPNYLLEPVQRLDRVNKFPLGGRGGYDLQVYQVVERSEASPEAVEPPAPGKRAHPGSS